MDFGENLVTAGYDPSDKKLYHLCLPDRLDGYSVLDVGAYDGFFSFHVAQRGARVMATDKFVWTWPGSTAYENFTTVRRLMNADVEDMEVGVEELSEKIKEKFDIVLFLGVLYHAPNMLAYLEQAASVTKHVCLIETFLDNLDVQEPSAIFYPPDTMNSDSSNWWGPNIAAVIEMAKRAGFKDVEFMNMWDYNTREILRSGSRAGPLRSGRAVFYAYK
jgi:tRNA (mo5U34)-methyltransferase